MQMCIRDRANTGGAQTVFIYAICIFLIYLILACLYESFLIPFAVIFSVPFGLMGSFLFAKVLGLENNIYLQTGVIMLIGLLAKTAILIKMCIRDRHFTGTLGFFPAICLLAYGCFPETL